MSSGGNYDDVIQSSAPQRSDSGVLVDGAALDRLRSYTGAQVHP